MQLNLDWASLSLLPSKPYSMHAISKEAVLGFAFDRQLGVHAIDGASREDFDAWPGELAVTRPQVEIFSESANGGEYLTLHIGGSDEFHALQQACKYPRAVIAGDRQAFRLCLKLRRLMLSRYSDVIEIEEHAAWLLKYSLAALGHLTNNFERVWIERKRLEHVLDYIEANLCGSLNLHELAQVTGMSKLQFLRSFTRAIGTTPHGFITERRLQRARKILQSPDANIAAVAFECGFSHQSHLGSLLKRQVGLTPKQYKKYFRPESS